MGRLLYHLHIICGFLHKCNISLHFFRCFSGNINHLRCVIHDYIDGPVQLIHGGTNRIGKTGAVITIRKRCLCRFRDHVIGSCKFMNAAFQFFNNTIQFFGCFLTFSDKIGCLLGIRKFHKHVVRYLRNLNTDDTHNNGLDQKAKRPAEKPFKVCSIFYLLNI